MAIDPERIVHILSSCCSSVEVEEHRGDYTFRIPKECLVEAATLLRDHPELQFAMLTDITAVDWYNRRKPRFEVVYFLLSLQHRMRIRLKVGIDEDHPHCPSVTEVWESANWYERETYDMFGIIFDNHPDLRRFYMPEDFVDPVTGEPLHPLRKDFPLMGVPGSLPMPEKYPKATETKS